MLNIICFCTVIWGWIFNILMKKANKKLVKAFDLTSCYIDNLVSINNPRFKQFLKDIYPELEELVVSETSELRNVVSYLNLLIGISNSALVYSIFDKRDASDLDIINFPDLSGNNSTAPAYDTYISQLIRYSRASHNYDNFSSPHSMLAERPRFFCEKTDEKILQIYRQTSRTWIKVQQESIIDNMW